MENFLEPMNKDLVEMLRNKGDMNSPRVRNLISIITYSNASHTEMIIGLVQNFIDMDIEMTNLMKDLIDCRSTSTIPYHGSGHYQN